MTWTSKRFFSVSCPLVLAAFSSPLYSQQSTFQTSFLSPVAVHLPATGMLADIAETEHLPYINQVAKESRRTFLLSTPTPLIC